MNELSTIFYFVNSPEEQIVLMSDGTNMNSYLEETFPYAEPSDDVLQKIMAIA